MRRPEVGITIRWYDEDTLQLLHDDVVVAEAFFNGGQWVFFEQNNGTNLNPQAITLDPDLEAQHRRDSEAIAGEIDPTKRSVLHAELSGRRKMYRDDEENRELVVMRAKQLARKLVRDRGKR